MFSQSFVRKIVSKKSNWTHSFSVALFTLIHFLYTPSFGQDTPLYSQGGPVYSQDSTTSKPKNRFSVYMRPLAMKANYASIQFGTDYSFVDKVRFGLVMGYGTSSFLKHPESYILDYNLYEFHPQIQILLFTHSPYVRFGLGAEFVFNNITSHYGSAQYSPRYGVVMEFDQATYSEKIRAVHILSSVIVFPQTDILIEVYFGLGFRSRIIEFTDIVNERPKSSGGGGSWFTFPQLGGPPKKNIGEQGGFSGTLGVKLGYRF